MNEPDELLTCGGCPAQRASFAATCTACGWSPDLTGWDHESIVQLEKDLRTTIKEVAEGKVVEFDSYDELFSALGVPKSLRPVEDPLPEGQKIRVAMSSMSSIRSFITEEVSAAVAVRRREPGRRPAARRR